MKKFIIFCLLFINFCFAWENHYTYHIECITDSNNTIYKNSDTIKEGYQYQVKTFDFDTDKETDFECITNGNITKTENIYTVTLTNLNGVSLENTELKYHYRDKIGELPVLEKEDYNFLGWYKDTTKIIPDMEITENLTIKAAWQTRHYIINHQNFINYAKQNKVKEIIFTDIKVPENIDTYELSWYLDRSVLGYIEDNKLYITTQKEGQSVLCYDWTTEFFKDIKTVEKIDLSKFEFLSYSSQQTMGSWFANCENLKEIVWGERFKTSNVTDMTYVFQNCKSLESLDLSSFDTSSAKDMRSMFWNCENLKTINLSNFKTLQVADFGGMFDGCKSLAAIDLSKFDTSKATKMDYMFRNCESLTSLVLDNFSTSNVTTMKEMFMNCHSLTSLNLNSFYTPNLEDASYMFSDCWNLKTLNFKNMTTSEVKRMAYMFHNTAIESIDVSKFDTSNVVSMWHMFSECRYLKRLDLSNFNTSSLTTIASMFSECYALEELNVSSFNTSKIESFFRVFWHCENLTSLNVSNFNTSKATTFSGMFGLMKKLEVLDLTNFDTRNVTDMAEMFGDGSEYQKDWVVALKTIYVGENWVTSKVTSSTNMFLNAHNLPGWDANYVDVTKAYVGGYLSSKK